jgi:hypothetical protein
MKRVLVVVTVAVLALLAASILRAQSNLSTGTWKLNVAKSQYSPGPPPQSMMRTFEPQGDDAVKVTSKGTAGDGSDIAYSYTAKYDGKDNPILGTGVPNAAETIALKRISPNTAEATLKKAGKAVVMTRNVVSKTGRVMTVTAGGTNANGQPTNNVTVWDKQ